MVHPTAAARSGNGLLRVIGRVFLWACVILLLARGVAATITDTQHRQTVTVTVTHRVISPIVSGGGR